MQALLLVLLESLLVVLSLPAVDRPGKQRDYAKLSHPEGINTVLAKATVEQAKPLTYTH